MVTIKDRLSAAGAGAIIEVSPQRINAATDSELSNYSSLNLHQALDLDVGFHKATHKPGPLLAAYTHKYEERTKGVVELMPEIERIGMIAKETGDVVMALTTACHPESAGGRRVTSCEAQPILTEIYEAIRVFEAAAADLKHRAGMTDAETPPASTGKAA
jgi:hypothetical protein